MSTRPEMVFPKLEDMSPRYYRDYYIYAFITTDRRFIKLGMTRDLEGRLKLLSIFARRHFGSPLKILGAFIGLPSDERALLRKFAQLGVAGHNEWFHWTQDMERFVKAFGFPRRQMKAS